MSSYKLANVLQLYDIFGLTSTEQRKLKTEGKKEEIYSCSRWELLPYIEFQVDRQWHVILFQTVRIMVK